MPACVGVDGCRAGWVAVIDDGDGIALRVAARFDGLLTGLPDDALVAVDMPIGLPDRVGPGGRGPEAAIRPFLGARQSSVFSIPSRPAVFAETYAESCAVALATSEPPRKVSKQGFFLFGKIREIDTILREKPALAERVFECHPELAFWRLNHGQAMATPKKIRGRVNPDGMAERLALLVGQEGYAPAFFDAPLPRGVGADDRLDAAVLARIARRRAEGRAEPFPPDFRRDAHGLPIAIWA